MNLLHEIRFVDGYYRYKNIQIHPKEWAMNKTDFQKRALCLGRYQEAMMWDKGIKNV